MRRLILPLLLAAFPFTARAYDFVVDKDGKGDFVTVQEAIDAAPDYSHSHVTSIHINAGVYEEMVTIPANKRCLHISGDGAGKTVIRFGKYATASWPRIDMKVGTSGSATLYVHASDVTFQDLTVENTAGDSKEVAQAVAVFTNGDRIFFHRCRLVGNQDTLYTYGRFNEGGGIMRNCFIDCVIEGTTDFIFGPSIAWFENCTIHSKKNSYVTAASTLKGQKWGYVFVNCNLTAAPGITKCYLGRPWGAYAKTVFIDCTMGPHILKEGWHDWEKPGKPDTRKNSFYAEYGSKGPGAASRRERASWSHTLSAGKAAGYTFRNVMQQDGDSKPWEPLKDNLPE